MNAEVPDVGAMLTLIRQKVSTQLASIDVSTLDHARCIGTRVCSAEATIREVERCLVSLHEASDERPHFVRLFRRPCHDRHDRPGAHEMLTYMIFLQPKGETGNQ